MDIDSKDMRRLSIVIAYHNEERLSIQKCVDQIQETIDIPEWEIIIVDDYSAKPLQPMYRVKIIRNERNKGVGQSFDRGVAAAQYDNVMVMGSDIRFIANGWASKLVDEIEAYPRALTCTMCVRLGRGSLSQKYATSIEDQIAAEKYGLGATIRLNGGGSIIDAMWLYKNGNGLASSYEVPCVLGAAYGAKKQWYQYIGGFEGHMVWGTLEPLISIKSWMFGGSCRVAPHIQVGHLFNIINRHYVHSRYTTHNKFLIATLLLPNPERYIGILQKTRKGKTDLLSDAKWIKEKKREYKQKTVLSFDEYCNKFKLN